MTDTPPEPIRLDLLLAMHRHRAQHTGSHDPEQLRHHDEPGPDFSGPPPAA